MFWVVGWGIYCRHKHIIFVSIRASTTVQITRVRTNLNYNIVFYIRRGINSSLVKYLSSSLFRNLVSISFQMENWYHCRLKRIPDVRLSPKPTPSSFRTLGRVKNKQGWMREIGWNKEPRPKARVSLLKKGTNKFAQCPTVKYKDKVESWLKHTTWSGLKSVSSWWMLTQILFI